MRLSHLIASVSSALVVGVVVVAQASGGGGAADAGQSASPSLKDAVEREFSAFKLGAPTSRVDPGLVDRMTKGFARRGEQIEPADVRRVFDDASTTVDIFTTSRSLCFRVRNSDASGSVNCGGLAADIADPLISVDKTADGMRLTLLVPDGISSVAITSAGTMSPVPVRSNVVSVEVDDVPAKLQWLNLAQQLRTQTVTPP
jgi:hypothetical protein